MSKRPISKWDDRVMCGILGLRYDFVQHRGELNLSPGECCDMQGCINMFLRIDPDVDAIDTFSGGNLDTSYYNDGRKWHAVPCASYATRRYSP